MTVRGKQWGGESRKTLPWLDDERLYIEGRVYLYTYHGPSDVTVHLPGGGDMPLHILKAQGCKIIEPICWRVRDFKER